MGTTAITFIILIAVISLSISGWIAFKRLYKAMFSDEITFIKGDKKVTISNSLNSSTKRKELVGL